MQNVLSRRDALLLGVSLATSAAMPRQALAAPLDQRLLTSFQEALAAPDFEAAERAWGRAIGIAPNNGPALSNRGTVRLQNGRRAIG